MNNINEIYVIDDEIFDNLDWEDIEQDQIPGLLQGYTVVGMEPIVTPEHVDGLIIYLEGKDQQMVALDIAANQDRGECDDAVRVMSAKIPKKTK